jgi:hypothetical protein
MKRNKIILVVFIFFSIYIMSGELNARMKGGKKMQIVSPAFKNQELIPSKYTCDGANISPPIQWEQVPAGAQSLALIMEDPDAPSGTFFHWVLYDLPPSLTGLPEKVPSDKTLANGGKQGTNSYKKIGYGGPCPPNGTHRYYFKLYALDTKLNLDSGMTRDDLLKSIKGHILAEVELIGKYKRQK